MGISLLTLRKTPVFLQFIVTGNWPTQEKNQKEGFWPKLLKCLADLNFSVLLHIFSRYVNCKKKFRISTHKVLGNMARIALQTDGRTDRRTYTKGKTIHVSGRGRHIIQRNERFWEFYFLKKDLF